MADKKYLDKDQIKETWGEEFLKLADDGRIHFDEDAICVDLITPVRVVGKEKTETVSTVRFPEPDVSILKTTDAAKGPIAKAAILVGSALNIADADINTMKTRDFMRCQKVALSFLDGGQATGEM